MSKPSKKARLFFKEIAKKLPLTTTDSQYDEVYTGEVLKLAGHTEIDGKPIEDEKKYLVPNLLLIEDRHVRRMRRRYKKYGKKGVVKYLMEFMKEDSRSWVVANVDKFCN